MSNLKYFTSIAIPPGLFLCAWIALFMYQLGTPVEKHLAKRGLWWEAKKTLVERYAEEQKLVIIAGSNSYMSLSAKDLEEKLGITTINAALMASFGIKYYVDSLSSYLRPGDTVLMPLEYWFYDKKWGKNDYLFDTPLFITRQDAEYYRSLGLIEKITFSTSVAANKIYSGALQKYQEKPSPLIKPTEYSEEWRGDVEQNFKHNPKLFEKITHYDYQFDSDSLQLERLREFSLWAREHGVQIVATYPSFLSSSSFSAPSEDLLAGMKDYWRSLNVPLLGEAPHFYYAPQYIFDTPYHLTAEGRSIHSERMARHICNAIENGILSANTWGENCAIHSQQQ